MTKIKHNRYCAGELWHVDSLESNLWKDLSRSHHAFGAWPSEDFCPLHPPWQGHLPSILSSHTVPLNTWKGFSHRQTQTQNFQLKLCSGESQDAGHLGSKHQQDTNSISLQIWLLLCHLGSPKHSSGMWFLCMPHLFIHLLAWKSPLIQIHWSKPPDTNLSRLLNTGGNHKCHERISCPSSSLLKMKLSCLFRGIILWGGTKCISHGGHPLKMSHSWSHRLFCLLCYLTLVLSTGRKECLFCTSLPVRLCLLTSHQLA